MATEFVNFCLDFSESSLTSGALGSALCDEENVHETLDGVQGKTSSGILTEPVLFIIQLIISFASSSADLLDPAAEHELEDRVRLVAEDPLGLPAPVPPEPVGAAPRRLEVRREVPEADRAAPDADLPK